MVMVRPCRRIRKIFFCYGKKYRNTAGTSMLQSNKTVLKNSVHRVFNQSCFLCSVNKLPSFTEQVSLQKYITLKQAYVYAETPELKLVVIRRSSVKLFQTILLVTSSLYIVSHVYRINLLCFASARTLIASQLLYPQVTPLSTLLFNTTSSKQIFYDSNGNLRHSACT